MPLTQTHATQPVISVYNDTDGGSSVTFAHIGQLHITDSVIAPSNGLQPRAHTKGLASPPVQDAGDRREEQLDEPEGSWVSSNKGGSRYIYTPSADSFTGA